jgi:hypothetical protein
MTISAADVKMLAILEWVVADERTRHAWANHDDATRDGAYCLALAAIEVANGLVAVRRAEVGTGADYYVAPPETDPQDLEDWFRIEVSGVGAGDITSVKRRLREKLQQTSKGKSNLPAMAAVVGFGAKLILMERLEIS